ncbi:hypothetical protein IQ06DRAFT_292296 [Phaeosphaeriaceae sp. SRC1lsM3a]|nr:hypothetical protein IQ06DRAFT_292296 [Stagonospora sp. SRC1lsM3a]
MDDFNIYYNRSYARPRRQNDRARSESSRFHRVQVASLDSKNAPYASNPRKTSSRRSSSYRPKYRYRPMRDPKGQIRLLRIRKVRSGLLGELSMFDEDDSVPYKALSYTWGDSRSDKHRILLCNVDDRDNVLSPRGYLEITKSLYELLIHIAPHSQWSSWLWTDAICIQQKDDPSEKTHQLRKMKEIYGNASEVFAWLGSGTPASDSGMKAIKQQSRITWEARRGQRREYNPLSRESNETGSTFRHDDFNSWLAVNLYDLKDIFRRQYWTRKWILQELAVSKRSATIACGNYAVRWSEFVDVAMRIASCEDISRRLGLQHHVWLLAQIYKEDSRQLCMSKVIYLTHNARCGNVTDTVHAVMGLVTMGHGIKLRLNSDDSPQTVLYRAVQCMVSDLRLLASNDSAVWGRKLKRWRRQAAWIRDKRQSERRRFDRYITMREAIWEECEDARAGLTLCHQLARICHEREVLYDYHSPDGVKFNCTLTRVNRVRRCKLPPGQWYSGTQRARIDVYSTSRRYVY